MKKIISVIFVSLLLLCSNARAEILLDSMSVDVNGQGTGSFSLTKKIRIDNKAMALKHSIIVYDYDPLTAKAEFAYVNVTKKDGNVINIDLAEAKDYVAPARLIFWGASQIMIDAGHLDEGDILSYEIKKKGFTYALLLGATDDEERFVPPMRGQFYDIVPFWVDEPTKRKIYRIALPDTCHVQYKFFQGECQSEVSFAEGKQILQFSISDAKPFGYENSILDNFDVAPKLMLSTTKNWIAKSKWFNKVNEDFGSFDPTPKAEAKVKEILKGKKGEMERISALTHWVADNIRYSGISMGKGEGYTLHKLDMDFTDRCGVCKDIAGTLIGMLRIAGFEAYPAMTMAGSRVEKIPADHFNHCVVVVKLSDGTWLPLDPTWVPFSRELWSSAEQQQNYLPGIPGGSDLCITPVSAPENHYMRINAKNKLDSKGTLRGSFTIEAEGQSDKSVRNVFLFKKYYTWAASLEGEILKVSPMAKVTNVDYGNDPQNYQSAPIKIKFSYEIPNYAVCANGCMTIKPMVMSGLYEQVCSFLRVNTPEQRKYDFKDGCSREVELYEEIELPKGKTCNIDKKDKIDSKTASIDSKMFVKDGKLVLSQKASFSKRVYKATESKDFHDVVEAYKSYKEPVLVK